MSYDKQWREFWIKEFVQARNIDGSNLRDAFDKPAPNRQIHVIEHAAYEAEKQRADRLEKILRQEASSNDELGSEFVLVQLLKEENQKLKAALRWVASEGQDLSLFEQYDRETLLSTVKECAKKAREALK